MSYELIAVDPGETNGWAQFIDGECVKFGTLKWENEIFDWITEQSPNYWIVEDYIIRPEWAAGANHDFNRGITLQVIGAIKLWARAGGAVVNLQQPSLKPAAYGQMGATYVKGKKNMHHMDAIAHGTWYINHKLGGLANRGKK